MAYSPYTNQYQTEINKQVGKAGQVTSKWLAVAAYQALTFTINFVKSMVGMILGRK